MLDYWFVLFFTFCCASVLILKEKKNGRKTRRQIKKEREREGEREAMQPGGNIILPSQRDAAFKTLDSHSTRESMVLLCHV